MDCILAIDIGTTSSKALVVQPDGSVVGSSHQGYPTYYPQPGYAEQDPVEIFEAVKKIVCDCTLHHGRTIRAVSISSAMHSLLAVDAMGSPLTPLMIWADTRSSEQAKRINAFADAHQIYQASGTPLHPMSQLCKLLWLKEQQPSVFSSAAKFISIKEYIVHRLTGEFKTDFSVASSGGLFDVHSLNWSADILSIVGIDASRLSDCVSPYHTISIALAWLRTFSLEPGTPLVMGASDGCLANLGSDAMDPGELSLTIGTSGAVRTASPNYSPDPHRRIFNYRLDEKMFIAGGATNNGLVLINWFEKLMGRAETTFAEFTASAMTSVPGAAGLLFLPFVFGERAPYHNPDMRGVFFGLAQHHTRADMQRALVEGIFFELRTILQCVEEVTRPMNIILASGGFTRSDAWLQLLANVMNKTVGLRDTNDASALGAAHMGFTAMGIPFQFTRQQNQKEFHPEPEYRQLYDDLFSVFVRCTNALLPEFANVVLTQKSTSR